MGISKEELEEIEEMERKAKIHFDKVLRGEREGGEILPAGSIELAFLPKDLEDSD